MIDPIGGIFAFLGLGLSYRNRSRKADEYLEKKKRYIEPKRKIEKKSLYYEDLKLYGARMVGIWQAEGKYEYTPADKAQLAKRKKEIESEYENLYKLVNREK